MAHTFVLKRIPLWPVIKMSFVVFIIIGIVIGVFYAIMLSMWGALMSSFTDAGFGAQFGMLRGLGFVLIPSSRFCTPSSAQLPLRYGPSFIIL